ncbi:sialidase family protein [Amycolatopsis sp. H20-H5]|uniref:sialidase family protein n=1 Tax=Amycolatopsis sp. H20-H5 TaxID=3046309 RepID=UPI002DBC5EEB|nr:sialidase family protein [Amycolatopsis sp. H20-H5]MEC3981957.1 sialidase family protein [Amycolatopsis sp. H20-H5]
MPRRPRPLTVPTIGVTILGVVALSLFAVPTATAQPFGFTALSPVQQRHVSGLMSTVLNGEDPANIARRAAAGTATPAAASACVNQFGANVKVNQNCLNLTDADLQGRGQSQNETWAAADPNNPQHVISSYNDYRRGDGTCGVTYSLDGARTWADATTPNGFVRGADFGGTPREYWQSGGDTSVAWDSRGNAYLSCQVFNRGAATSPNPDQSSAFLVYRSTGTNGASWNFTGRPVATHNDTAGAGNFLLDKQLLTVDNNVRSPYRDRVYLSWTTFADDGTAYIYEAYSADYGETFSAPVLVSADSALCPNGLGAPTPRGRCTQNQDSQPFVGPDGALYVVYDNFNNALTTPTDNHSQVLLSRSADGGQSFTAPVLVSTYNELPDCAAYQNGQDPGRACVPEKGPSANSIFRASNYPIGAVDPQHPHRIIVTHGSYLNRNSNENTGCTPAGINPATALNLYTGVKTGTCNNDIVLSTSDNSGATFTGTGTDVRQLPVVTTGNGQARTDQFWQGAAFSPDGTFAVSYYDRRYGSDENTGFSDITVSTSRGGTAFTHTRATSGSMPPPTQFNGTFYGDYAGIAVTSRTAYPVWSDTRPVDLFLCPGTGTPANPPRTCQAGAPNASIANDQDTYITAVDLH